MKKQLLFLVLTMLPLVASADAVEIDGIYYNLISETNSAVVTSNAYNYAGSIVIPETVNYNDVTYSVTSIGFNAFYSCPELTSVTIGSGVTSIGSYAFGGADIPTIISLIENPYTISSNIFSQNTFDNAKLYVPIGTIDKYKATEGWKYFAFIEEGYPSGINVVENTKSSNTAIYNLNGARQSELKKGVNILNGKKVIVK